MVWLYNKSSERELLCRRVWGESRYMAHYDKPREECGLFGIWGIDEAAHYTILGLHALQHRGQEATGIVTKSSKSAGDDSFRTYHRLGLVGDVFAREDVIDKLKGVSAIGHNRYSTKGGNTESNIQPLCADLSGEAVALAHNGNLTNAMSLKKELSDQGALFHSTCDTEVILQLMANVKGSVMERLEVALHSVKGAYSLVLLSENSMIGVRDPLGIRPLVIGKKDEAYILCSETCALDIIGAEFVREVRQGEMVVINDSGLYSYIFAESKIERPCIFEYVYFSRPDSIVKGKDLYSSRCAMGEELAKESLLSTDMVIPVPDSGTPAAIGYAQKSQIPLSLGIIRNHYKGRSFIEPTNQIRYLGVKLKHNANKTLIAGKSVLLIDDSIVRGITAKKIVDMIREAGAKEVHFMVSSPMVKFPCYYGIDMPTEQELLSHHHETSIELMADYLGVDSLHFLSLEGLYKALGSKEGRNNEAPQYTDHFFTGEYPVPLVDLNSSQSVAKSHSLFEYIK